MSHGNDKGRILRLQELTALVPYSPQHLRRLEEDNQCPRRVRRGPNRVGWVREEIENWLNARIGGR